MAKAGVPASDRRNRRSKEGEEDHSGMRDAAHAETAHEIPVAKFATAIPPAVPAKAIGIQSLRL